MRRLTIVVAILALICSAFWFIGARTATQTVTTQIETLRAKGWEVNYDAFEISGFPSRFESTTDALTIAVPTRRFRYEAPLLQPFALSYQPNRTIVVFPPSQSLTLAGQAFDVQSTGLRASLGVAANTALSLDDVTVEAETLALNNASSDSLSAEGVLLALRAAEPVPNSYDIYATGQNITLPPQFAQLLAQTEGLPSTVAMATFDARIVLDKPLNRHTLPAWNTNPGHLRDLELRSFTLKWGDIVIASDGALQIDADGTPEGTVSLRVTEWEHLLDLALRTGALPPNLGMMARSMGQSLVDDTGALSLPVTFQNGNMAIGAFPVGPAPKFH